MFQLDDTLHPSLAPLAWLVGRWEGAGVWGYPTTESGHFGQEIIVTHDGRPFLEMHSHSWLLDKSGAVTRPSAAELGFWRVQGDGTVELLLTHMTGILELFVGTVPQGRASVELRTDAVLRSAAAKEYNAASRMYGLVDSELMWVMDMAAMGEEMTSHLSARLKRVGPPPPATPPVALPPLTPPSA